MAPKQRTRERSHNSKRTMTRTKDEVLTAFGEQVNMSADQLEEWLQTPESQQAGQVKAGDSESVGHHRCEGNRALSPRGPPRRALSLLCGARGRDGSARVCAVACTARRSGRRIVEILRKQQRGEALTDEDVSHCAKVVRERCGCVWPRARGGQST